MQFYKYGIEKCTKKEEERVGGGGGPVSGCLGFSLFLSV